MAIAFGLLAPVAWVILVGFAISAATALPTKVGIDAVLEAIKFLVDAAAWVAMTGIIGLAVRDWTRRH